MNEEDKRIAEAIAAEHRRIVIRNEYIERWVYLFSICLLILSLAILSWGCASTSDPCGDKPPIYGTDC